MTRQGRNFLILGTLCTALGIALYIYSVEERFSFRGERGKDVQRSASDARASREIRNRLREADEYLRQNTRSSARRAQTLFTRIYTLEKLSRKYRQLSRHGLGVALEKQGDRAAALGHFRGLKKEGIEDGALADKNDYRLGRLLLIINHEAEGRSLLEATLARTNDRLLKSKIHTALGFFYLRRGARRRARENFTIALKYFPDNLRAELGRADALRAMGRYDLAFDYYDDYLIGPSRLRPRHRRRVMERVRRDSFEIAIRSYRAGRYARAARFFRKTLATEGRSSVRERARYWLAESYYQRRLYTSAFKLFGKVLSNENTRMDQAALIKRGIILFRRGKMKDAARSFQRAEREFPRGAYWEQAREWRREAEAQIRDDVEINRDRNRDIDSGREDRGGKRGNDKNKNSSGDEPDNRDSSGEKTSPGKTDSPPERDSSKGRESRERESNERDSSRDRESGERDSRDRESGEREPLEEK